MDDWTPDLFRDPAKLVAKLVEAGERYADLNAAAKALEETKGSVLGQLVTTYINQGKPAGASEHMARANGIYQSHIHRMVDAQKEAIKAKVRWEALEAYMELMRTKEASRRAEMQLGGRG